jgi:SynChlorMet cassette protein ScmC
MKLPAQHCAPTDLGLELADGARWVIGALDEEAEGTVQELGRVMQLGTGEGKGGGKSRGKGTGRVCVVSGWKGGYGGRTVVCRLGPARGRHAEVFRMERIATAIVEHSLARGGLLLHAALAVRDRYGVLLAGPSGVGKSTASRRLPAPWQSLSDDSVLVVRDKAGRYWAHPWPTWSLLRKKGTVASWPVEQAVPLKALMFLNQSSFDRAEPVGTTLATALVVESALHLIETVTLTQDGYASRAICRKYLRAAWALAAAVPAFRLQVSLTGRFWEEIERAVLREQRIVQNPESRVQNPELQRENTGARQQTRAKADKAKLTNPGRRTRSVPEPPRGLLSGRPKPMLVLFRTRDRAYLKLVRGRRVTASANDLLREWYYGGGR